MVVWTVHSKYGTGENGTNGKLVKMAHFLKNTFKEQFRDFFNDFMKFRVYTC